MSLMIISFDAVCDDDLDYISTLPSFSALIKNGSLVRETESVFITNTYPVHSSVITGCYPAEHGIIENTYTQPERERPDWRWYRRAIKTTTLYDEAAKLGLKTCAVLWPVTAGAKIKYNIPEIFSPQNKNQILLSLKAGSKLFQLDCFLRYGRKLKGINQPNLDDFSLASALHAVNRHKADLLLLHLTDADTHKHKFGPKSKEVKEAMARLDKKLGMLMENCTGWDIIVFGDHGCLPVVETVDLNGLWSVPGTYWHQAGGCAFLKLLNKDIKLAYVMNDVNVLINNSAAHIGRIISKSEMAISGLDTEFDLGVEGKPGFCYGKEKNLGQHGYSLHNSNYKTFYAAAGKGIPKGCVIQGGKVIDIAPLAARLLGVSLWEMDGKDALEAKNDKGIDKWTAKNNSQAE